MEHKTELNNPPGVEYREYDWGDWITGTKEQLQAMGLGVALAYPGEQGGPKKKMTVRELRGYAAEISRNQEGTFTARIRFTERPERPSPDFLPVFPGVKKREHHRFDEYIGTAEALTAAGLVLTEQLPGQPGMRKMRVTIFPDGTIPSGAPTANHPEARLPGARHIERAGAREYCIRINVLEEEQARRWMTEKAAEAAWERAVRAMSRPPRLRDATAPMADDVARAPVSQPARGHLRLIWSAT